MSSILSARRQARWTLTALIALSLLPACANAQDFEYRAVRCDADVAFVTEKTEGVIVYPRVSIHGARELAKLKLKAVAAYPDDSKLEVSGAVLQELLSCPTLENVSVRNFASLTDDDFAPLANLRNLNALELRTLPGITATTLKYAATPTTLAGLTLTGCQKVSSAALVSIAQMPLVGLTLEGKQFDCSGLRFAQTANLSFVSLEAIAAVDDAFLDGLRRFPLSQLSISSVAGALPGVTAKGLASLSAIGTLEAISLDGAGSLNDRLLQRFGAMEKLTSLSLSGGKSPSVYLTSAGVLALLRSKAITDLSLSGQNKIAWNIGKEFSAGASIQNIDLTNTSMDDANLELLAKRLDKSGVKSIDTRDCSNVSDAGRLIANKINECIDAGDLACGIRQ